MSSPNDKRVAARPARAALLLQQLMVVAGGVCLGWAVDIWVETRWYQAAATAQIEQILATHAPVRPVATDTRGDGDSVLGQLDVPRIGLSVIVLEGDDERTLRLAVGHLPDTPRPWEEGNAALAGHRDSFFRPLERLRVGDAISLLTRHGSFHYRVRSFRVVAPDAVWVLEPSQGVHLTLITCYPFRYVGSAPQRFVVQAERVPAGT
jgi:sortase A